MKASVQISRGVESLFGTRDENMRLIEAGLKVNTQLIDNLLVIEGESHAVSRAAQRVAITAIISAARSTFLALLPWKMAPQLTR